MKTRSLTLLLLGEVLVMSLWFVSAAILPEMMAESGISKLRQAALSSGVQAGFVAGALVSAATGLADRFDPRRVFALSAVAAGLINATLLIAAPGSIAAITARFATGALLAGVYPVGMKIAVGWGRKDRGLLVGALVGALTLGSASPHLIALFGGADWRVTVGATSLAAIMGGLLCQWVVLGPFHAVAARFNVHAITSAWTNRRVRLAYAGYLGHMWELYAMWAWIGVAATVSYGATLPTGDARQLGTITAFAAIGSGAVTSVLAGLAADRVGKANIAMIAMILSGASAVATALTFGGPVWLTFALILVWGATIVPDSAQFSALVADHSGPEVAGSLMTFQTALGFALTFGTVQITPLLADSFGWPIVLAGLALGPAYGIAAMVRLRALD
jgi:MFS family permease